MSSCSCLKHDTRQALALACSSLAPCLKSKIAQPNQKRDKHLAKSQSTITTSTLAAAHHASHSPKPAPKGERRRHSRPYGYAGTEEARRERHPQERATQKNHAQEEKPMCKKQQQFTQEEETNRSPECCEHVRSAGRHRSRIQDPRLD